MVLTRETIISVSQVCGRCLVGEVVKATDSLCDECETIMSSKTMTTYRVVVEFRGPADVVMPTAPVNSDALDTWLEALGVNIEDEEITGITVSRLDRPAVTCEECGAGGEGPWYHGPNNDGDEVSCEDCAESTAYRVQFTADGKFTPPIFDVPSMECSQCQATETDAWRTVSGGIHGFMTLCEPCFDDHMDAVHSMDADDRERGSDVVDLKCVEC